MKYLITKIKESNAGQTSTHPYFQRRLHRAAQILYMVSTSGPVVDVYPSSYFNTIPSCYSAIYTGHDKCSHHPQVWDRVAGKGRERNGIASSKIPVIL